MTIRPAAGALLAALLAASTSTPTRSRRPSSAPHAATVTIHLTLAPVNRFYTDEALGAGVDGQQKGEIAQVYTPRNLAAMRSAGLRPLTYRLRTELGVEAWHWNPQGRWSDPARNRGYWISAPNTTRPILQCYGYRLPRRGSTIDQANNDGYSRIDDGDPATYWKSNPYLDRYYTHEDDALHPQWLLIDLGKAHLLNAIRILWGEPYATHYRVEYWQGRDAVYINENPPGQWRVFRSGAVETGRGGSALQRLAPQPIRARFVRVLMTAASGTALTSAADVRDRLGYAVREVYLGRILPSGQFADVIRHGHSNQRQTVIYASSTDPWHRACDLDLKTEQPGFDRVFRSGLTNGLPMMVPVPLLYDNPENAANEVRYLHSRGYSVGDVEMGEEPDGQHVTPEDYGALYARVAAAVHAVDRGIRLGGPCFQTTITDVAAWPDGPGNRSWFNRLLTYLRGHGEAIGFFTFEWYPFDNTCAATAPQLAAAPQVLAGVMRRMQRDGLSRDIPWMITEYGYSAFSGQAEVDVPGALLNADIVGEFLALGGARAYLYGYEPNTLIKERPECNSWGNLTLFLSQDDRKAGAPMPTYWAARLYGGEWAQPGHALNEVYAADCDARNPRAQPLITAYALRRADGRWALMLINKDPLVAWTVRVKVDGAGAISTRSAFGSPVDLYSYSGAQYRWHAAGKAGRPVRDLPPAHSVLPAGPERVLTLPAYSLTVVRER